MASQGSGGDPLVTAFNKALDFYDQVNLPACIEACESLLEQGDAEAYRTKSGYKAEQLWTHGRWMFPKQPTTEMTSTELSLADLLPRPHYADAGTEAALDELRDLLDELAEIQTQEAKKIEGEAPREVLEAEEEAEEEEFEVEEAGNGGGSKEAEPVRKP